MSDLGSHLLSMVEDFGQQLTLTHQSTVGTYDPATGGISGSAVTTHKFKGYMYNSSQGTEGSSDNIESGSRVCAIPASTISVLPIAGDTISGQGDKVTVVAVHTTWDKSTKVSYQCEVRE